jgi:hypothetical protein
MEILKDATEVGTDINIYLNLRDHTYDRFLSHTEDDAIELKDLKLYMDILDKLIQNRIKLLVQIGKLDIDINEDERLESLSSAIFGEEDETQYE